MSPANAECGGELAPFAHRLYAKGYYQDALYEFIRLKLEEPEQAAATDASILMCLQRLYENQFYGDITRFVNLIDTLGIQQLPEFYRVAGHANFKLNRFRQSIGYYHHILRIDSLDQSAARWKCWAMVRLGEYSEAEQWTRHRFHGAEQESILKKIAGIRNYPEKNIHKARLLSLFPGGGYFYLHRNKTGFGTLFLTSVFTTMTYELMKKNAFFSASICGFVGFSWYAGSFWGAAKECDLTNKKNIETLKNDFQIP
jgi:hypothetical protein